MGFPHRAAESTDRKPGTERLTRTSSGEAGAEHGILLRTLQSTQGRALVCSQGHAGRETPALTCGSRPSRQQKAEASPRERLTLSGWNLPFWPNLSPPTPPPCAEEGIEKGLSRERLRAGCGNGIKAYANRPLRAFLYSSEQEPFSRKMLLLQDT